MDASCISTCIYIIVNVYLRSLTIEMEFSNIVKDITHINLQIYRGKGSKLQPRPIWEMEVLATRLQPITYV